MRFMLRARVDDLRGLSVCFSLWATITTCSPFMMLHYSCFTNTYVWMHACVYTSFLCIYSVYTHTLCIYIS